MQFPRVNKIFPTIANKSWVNVQPMSAPITSIFNLDFDFDIHSNVEVSPYPTYDDRSILADIYINIEKILSELS